MNTITDVAKTEQRELAAVIEQHPDIIHDLLMYAIGRLDGKNARSQVKEENA